MLPRHYHRVSRFSARQPIENSSRVPAYQNIEKFDGLCKFLFKSRLFEKRRGLVKRLKPLLKDKKRLEMLVKEVGVDGDLRTSCSKNL